MNPYEGVIQTLLIIQMLTAFLVITLTSVMNRRLRDNFAIEPVPWNLNRLHRELFPHSSLRGVRVVCAALCLLFGATSGVFIYKNSAENHIYIENARKQQQQDAQLIIEMEKKGR
jgi:ABC-type Fe3+ transport system permease subunit